MRYLSAPPRRVPFRQADSRGAVRGSLAASTPDRRLLRLLLWTLFTYEVWINFVQPRDPGFTLLHGFSYILILAVYAILVVNVLAVLRRRVLACLPQPMLRVYVFLLVWGVFSGLRVFDFGNFRNAAYGLVVNNTFGIWLMPFGLLLGLEPAFLSETLRVVRRQTILAGIIMSVAFLIDVEAASNASYSDSNLLYGAGLVLLVDASAGALRQILWLSTFGIYAMGQFVLGLRNGLLRVAVFATLYLLLQLRLVVQRGTSPLRLFILLLSTSLFLLSAHRFIQSRDVTAEAEVRSVEKISSMYNSRSGVVDEMLTDLSSAEWILGSRTGGFWSQTLRTTRYDVEGGYLSFLMRGGAVFVAAFLLLTLSAARAGLRRQSGSLPWLLALCILERLIWMISYGNPVVDVGYLVFWIAVGICLRPVLSPARALYVETGWSVQEVGARRFS